jgi:hypothetical protein
MLHRGPRVKSADLSLGVVTRYKALRNWMLVSLRGGGVN